MTHDDEPARIGYDTTRPRSGVHSFVGKVLALAAAAVLLVGAIALSLVAFAVIVAALLVVGIYLWWKTRDLRKRMRAANPDGNVSGNVIEGEVISRDVRDLEPHDRDRR